MRISETSGMCKYPLIFYLITGTYHCEKQDLVKATQQMTRATEGIYFVFTGKYHYFPVFPTIPGNTLISRLFDNPVYILIHIYIPLYTHINEHAYILTFIHAYIHCNQIDQVTVMAVFPRVHTMLILSD